MRAAESAEAAVDFAAGLMASGWRLASRYVSISPAVERMAPASAKASKSHACAGCPRPFSLVEARAVLSDPAYELVSELDCWVFNLSGSDSPPLAA